MKVSSRMLILIGAVAIAGCGAVEQDKSTQYYEAHQVEIQPKLDECTKNAGVKNCATAKEADDELKAIEARRKYQEQAEKSKAEAMKFFGGSRAPSVDPAITKELADSTAKLFKTRSKFMPADWFKNNYQKPVETCFQAQHSLVGCSSGKYHITDQDASMPEALDAAVTKDGVITVTGSYKGTPTYGITRVLTPTPTANGSLAWTLSGSCVAAKLCE